MPEEVGGRLGQGGWEVYGEQGGEGSSGVELQPVCEGSEEMRGGVAKPGKKARSDDGRGGGLDRQGAIWRESDRDELSISRGHLQGSLEASRRGGISRLWTDRIPTEYDGAPGYAETLRLGPNRGVLSGWGSKLTTNSRTKQDY